MKCGRIPFWDLVMPLFLFMTGLRYRFTVKVRRYVRQLLASSIGGFWGGCFCCLFSEWLFRKSAWTGQQSYLSLFKYFAVYCCRLFYCSSHSVTFSFRWQIGITLLLLFIYWIPMTFWVTSHRLETLPNRWTDVFRSFQRWCFLEWRRNVELFTLLQLHMDGAVWHSGDCRARSFAGKIMKEGKRDQKVVQTLSVIVVLLVGLAMLWSLQMPIIKRLWTGSMTLLSGGYCFSVDGIILLLDWFYRDTAAGWTGWKCMVWIPSRLICWAKWWTSVALLIRSVTGWETIHPEIIIPYGLLY